MRIKTLTAPRMEDALAIIRQQLGPEALILSTHKVKGPDGKPTLEITAAVPDDEPRPSREVAPLAATGRQPSASVLPSSPAPVGESSPQPESALATALSLHGVPRALISRITAALPGLASAGFQEEEALEMLLTRFIKFSPAAEILPAGKVHLFIGPHGAGKTTLVARLAIQSKKQGRTVGMLSLDDQKIGGFEPLAITAEILGDTAHLLTSVNDLRAAGRELGPRQLLLVDSPGINPFKPGTLSTLQQRLNELNLPITTHLVIPANMNVADMTTLPVACHRFHPAGIIFTHLDATTRYGGLLATAENSSLPVGLASHSADMSTPPLSLSAPWLAQALSQPPLQPWEFSA